MADRRTNAGRPPVTRRAAVTFGLGLAAAAHAAFGAPPAEFAGTWIVRSSATAPWKEPGNPLGSTEPGQLIGKAVTFAPGKVGGPSPIGCAKPVYRVETVGPDLIFEGQLAEPKAHAKSPDAVAAATALGFGDPRHIVTLDAGCTELQFHQVKPGTLAFGLNNRVYYMTRK